jgi:hypothetical protein
MAEGSAFPIKGQAFRLPVIFTIVAPNTILTVADLADVGNILSNWSTATVNVYIDGVVAATPTATASEIGMSGVGYVDLSAAQMNGSLIQFVASATASSKTGRMNAAVHTIDMSDITGRADAQATKRLEYYLMNMFQYMMNEVTAASTSLVVKKADGTDALTGVLNETDISTTRGKLT